MTSRLQPWAVQLLGWFNFWGGATSGTVQLLWRPNLRGGPTFTAAQFWGGPFFRVVQLSKGDSAIRFWGGPTASLVHGLPHQVIYNLTNVQHGSGRGSCVGTKVLELYL